MDIFADEPRRVSSSRKVIQGLSEEILGITSNNRTTKKPSQPSGTIF
jgi:hypothetical protein